MKKLIFLPVFMALCLCGTMFSTGANGAASCPSTKITVTAGYMARGSYYIYTNRAAYDDAVNCYNTKKVGDECTLSGGKVYACGAGCGYGKVVAAPKGAFYGSSEVTESWRFYKCEGIWNKISVSKCPENLSGWNAIRNAESPTIYEKDGKYCLPTGTDDNGSGTGTGTGTSSGAGTSSGTGTSGANNNTNHDVDKLSCEEKKKYCDAMGSHAKWEQKGDKCNCKCDESFRDFKWDNTFKTYRCVADLKKCEADRTTQMGKDCCSVPIDYNYTPPTPGPEKCICPAGQTFKLGGNGHYKCVGNGGGGGAGGGRDNDKGNCTGREDERAACDKYEHAHWDEKSCGCQCDDEFRDWVYSRRRRTGYCSKPKRPCKEYRDTDYGKACCDIQVDYNYTPANGDELEKCLCPGEGQRLYIDGDGNGKCSAKDQDPCNNDAAYWDARKQECRCIKPGAVWDNGQCVDGHMNNIVNDSFVDVVIGDPGYGFSCPDLYDGWEETYKTCKEMIDALNELRKICHGSPIDTTEHEKIVRRIELLKPICDSSARLTIIWDDLVGKKNVWRNKEGEFNTARLASDSVAGVVLGTAGGLITSHLVKKGQVAEGFENLQCTIGGQKVAGWGDEFTVGIQ